MQNKNVLFLLNQDLNDAKLVGFVLMQGNLKCSLYYICIADVVS